MSTFKFSCQKKGVVLITFIALSLATTQSKAQISIAPTSIFFDNQNRFSSLTISNGGQQPQEISISTEFSFPASPEGAVTMVSDSILAKEKSIASWIKIFPQSFTLQPQQRQVVRFVVSPPNNLDPGGYWARVSIRSSPVSPPIESVAEGEIGAQVNLVVNQVISAHYHTQNAATGVDITSVYYTQDEETQTGQIAIDMEQNGNAPFMGNISLQVNSGDGETIYQSNTTLSVYTTITRTFNIDLGDVQPGQYTVSGNITSERRDISQENLLQIKPVSFQEQITIE